MGTSGPSIKVLNQHVADRRAPPWRSGPAAEQYFAAVEGPRPVALRAGDEKRPRPIGRNRGARMADAEVC